MTLTSELVLMGKRELIALLNLSSWCLVMVERLFLAVPRGCLQFVIVVFPDHTHLLFLIITVSGAYLILFEIRVPKGWWSVMYHLLFILTLTSDLVFRIIMSGAYLFYY